MQAMTELTATNEGKFQTKGVRRLTRKSWQVIIKKKLPENKYVAAIATQLNDGKSKTKMHGLFECASGMVCSTKNLESLFNVVGGDECSEWE